MWNYVQLIVISQTAIKNNRYRLKSGDYIFHYFQEKKKSSPVIYLVLVDKSVIVQSSVF